MRVTVRSVVGFVLGLVVRLLVASWRLRLHAPRAIGPSPRPLVFAFWHGRQLPLLAVRRRRPCGVLVSWSPDGELQSGAMRAMGLSVVRGSSTRGGARGARALARALGGGQMDAAFAADGPRGPSRRAKPGAARIAAWAGGLLVPVGSAASACVSLGSAWDDFSIPLPFARVVVWLGEPIEPREAGHLDAAIERAMSDAETALAAERASARPRSLPAP